MEYRVANLAIYILFLEGYEDILIKKTKKNKQTTYQRNFKVTDTDGACLPQLVNFAAHVYGSLCVPNGPLALASIHLFIVGFCEHSLVVLEFQIERNEFHSSMPPFRFDPRTYNHEGYPSRHGFLSVEQQLILWKEPAPHDHENE